MGIPALFEALANKDKKALQKKADLIQWKDKKLSGGIFPAFH
jgi:hypothetical protein